LTRGGIMHAPPKKKRILAKRGPFKQLTKIQREEILQHLVIHQDLKGAAYEFGVSYPKVWRLFKDNIRVIWVIDRKAVQLDLFRSGTK
jgi:molybdenum-dependent DNA-binding transcriptional regulator ModE